MSLPSLPARLAGMMMNEDQLERLIERLVNRADATLMANHVTQAAYDQWMKDLNAWAEAESKWSSRKP